MQVSQHCFSLQKKTSGGIINVGSPTALIYTGGIHMDNNSLSHIKWNCKYHIVFAPKYRRKVAYGKMKQDIAYTYGLRTPCKFKIQIWESPFLVQRILRRYCRENAKKIQEYIQNQLHWSIDLCILSL